MILARHLYSSSPPPKSGRQNNPTLLVSWWCTGFAVAIIFVRLTGRYIRAERLFMEDKIMALSLIPLLFRMALIHLVLLWGTNNAITDALTPSDIQHREIASRLVLVARIMYAMFLWIAKFTISEFLKRLTSHVWKRSYEIGLQFIRWFLIVTFFAVVIATLSECQPFDHYWQVLPDPGARCRQGMAQLITMGTSDVITDLLIVGFPIPIVLKSTMATRRKLSLVLLFALSLILVGITIYRVISVIDRHADQQFRSLLASLEILAAAAVSNALVLGSFVRDRGTKKQRFRFGSTGGQSSVDRSTAIPRRAITSRHWGSDADLVGDLGMRLGPELSEKSSSGPRPAPIAVPLGSQAKSAAPSGVDKEWTFPARASAEIDESVLKSPKSVIQLQRSPEASPCETPITPRRVSFFDVGGLLGENDGPRRINPRHAIAVPERSPALSQQSLPESPSLHPQSASAAVPFAQARRGSRVLLQDLGGLLSPLAQEADPSSTVDTSDSSLIDALQSTPPSNPRNMTAPIRRQRGSPEIQDVGGLLS